MTTTRTPTDRQVRALRAEAATAGDRDMVTACDRYLATGDPKARDLCAEAIADATAQDDAPDAATAEDASRYATHGFCD